MPKPNYNGPQLPDQADQAAKDAAAAAGLPAIDGKQAMGFARSWSPTAGARNWYKLEDGTEAVRDDAGNPAQWPL